ncbi:sigma factor [Clostridium sp.]|uniref:sigma factor n=1 Tax=Clostridium sp. TaxID=1506 RepID=UPI002FC827A8
MNGYEFDDLRNETFITLFKCVELYNPNKHKFVAYAVSSIKNSINTLIRNSFHF